MRTRRSKILLSAVLPAFVLCIGLIPELIAQSGSAAEATPTLSSASRDVLTAALRHADMDYNEARAAAEIAVARKDPVLLSAGLLLTRQYDLQIICLKGVANLRPAQQKEILLTALRQDNLWLHHELLADAQMVFAERFTILLNGLGVQTPPLFENEYGDLSLVDPQKRAAVLASITATQ